MLVLSGIGSWKDEWRRESESGPIRVSRGLVWQYADALHAYDGWSSLLRLTFLQDALEYGLKVYVLRHSDG